MQVYRGMDIGTAKPDRATRERIPHALVDIADPEEEVSAAAIQDLGRAAITEAQAAKRPVIVAGGSGLHFRAIVDPLTFAPTDADTRERLGALDDDTARARLLTIDPEAGMHVDLGNPRRVVRALEVHELTGRRPTDRAAAPEALAVKGYEPHLPFVAFGIDAAGASAARVEARFDAMLEAGLVGEVTGLADRLGPTACHAVGYKQLLGVVEGSVPLGEARARAIRATNALVKRQRTFFGRDPRISWLPWHHDDDVRTDAAVRAIEEAVQWTS